MTPEDLGEKTVAATSAGKVRRDTVTRAGYTVMVSWGWFLYSFGAVLPLLRAEQGTSRTVTGLHSLALAVGGMVAGLVNEVTIRRLARRGAVALGAALVSGGVVALALAPTPVLSIAAVLVTGIGGSMTLNSAVPALNEHHGSGGAAILAEGNAVAAGVGLVAPLAVGAAAGLGLTWRPALLLVLFLLGVAVLSLRRVPVGTAAVDAGLPPRAGRPGRLPPVFWVYLALLMSCIAIEFCCTAWSADLLRQRTSLSAASASVGVTAVVTGMAVGRMAVGRLAATRSPRRLMAYALAMTVVGWAVVWPATHPAVALAGLVVVGLGLAGHYPLGMVMVLGSVPGRTDAASGRTSFGGSLASGIAPFALGAVADATSTHTAFLAVPVLVTLATAALVISSRLGPAAAGPAPRPPAPRRPPGADG